MRIHTVNLLGITLTLIGTSYPQTYTACDPTNGKRIFILWLVYLLNPISDLRTNAWS